MPPDPAPPHSARPAAATRPRRWPSVLLLPRLPRPRMALAVPTVRVVPFLPGVLLAVGLWTALPPPARGQDPHPPPGASQPPSAPTVDANTATEADLDSLHGLGPATTARLLHARAQRPFHSWADLMHRTPGVGPRTAQRLSAQGLRVNGQPLHADPPAKGQTAPQ